MCYIKPLGKQTLSEEISVSQRKPRYRVTGCQLATACQLECLIYKFSGCFFGVFANLWHKGHTERFEFSTEFSLINLSDLVISPPKMVGWWHNDNNTKNQQQQQKKTKITKKRMKWLDDLVAIKASYLKDEHSPWVIFLTTLRKLTIIIIFLLMFFTILLTVCAGTGFFFLAFLLPASFWRNLQLTAANKTMQQ